VQDGDVVELVSDNPTAVETIPAMMLSAYGSHLATVRREGCWKVYVRKGY
jgi:TusA-related sulfurtransferase